MTGVDSRYFEDRARDTILAKNPEPRRALFLDRDGVINVDRGYVHRADQTEWMPGIFDLCLSMAEAGFILVVVTNQAGIARGLYSESQFVAYTQWVHEAFRDAGAPLLATYYCPHHPVAGVGSLLADCKCRKPKPGMILDAAERYGIILDHSSLIGNNESDVQAGQAAGVGRNFLLEQPGMSQGLETPGSINVHTLLQAEQVMTAKDRRSVEE